MAVAIALPPLLMHRRLLQGRRLLHTQVILHTQHHLHTLRFLDRRLSIMTTSLRMTTTTTTVKRTLTSRKLFGRWKKILYWYAIKTINDLLTICFVNISTWHLNFRKVYTDDRFGNDEDDAWKNIVPESEAAAAFNLLSAIVCIVAITYTTYALCVSKRIKMMELGLSASFLFCSICLIITSAVVSVTLSEIFDDDDDDDKIPAGSPTPSPTANMLLSHKSTEITIKSDCSVGCIFSVIGAVWEFIVAIVWLVYAGTCKKEYFDGQKADRSEPSMASNIA